MRTTIRAIQKMKKDGERIPMLTTYDYTAAQLADRAGIPMLLVGDSLGMVVQGQTSTLTVTLDQIIYHLQMVIRGSKKALVIGDMPFLTYTSVEQAVQTAGRLLQEGGAQAVKLEGGQTVLPQVRRLVELGIPVMSHLGYTPQSENQIGRRVQARSAAAARQLLADALALEQAGSFALVLELVPAPLAREVSRRLHIPTIGIGAGPDCDGQVQVWHDLMGLYTDFQPRHARRYATLAESISTALADYSSEVRAGSFPTMEHASTMDEHILAEALRDLEPQQ